MYFKRLDDVVCPASFLSVFVLYVTTIIYIGIKQCSSLVFTLHIEENLKHFVGKLKKLLYLCALLVLCVVVSGVIFAAITL